MTDPKTRVQLALELADCKQPMGTLDSDAHKLAKWLMVGERSKVALANLLLREADRSWPPEHNHSAWLEDECVCRRCAPPADERAAVHPIAGGQGEARGTFACPRCGNAFVHTHPDCPKCGGQTFGRPNIVEPCPDCKARDVRPVMMSPPSEDKPRTTTPERSKLEVTGIGDTSMLDAVREEHWPALTTMPADYDHGLAPPLPIAHRVTLDVMRERDALKARVEAMVKAIDAAWEATGVRTTVRGLTTLDDVIRVQLEQRDEARAEVDRIHSAIGKRESHGSAQATAACAIDWIHDAKRAIADSGEELRNIRNLCGGAGCTEPGDDCASPSFAMVEELRQRGVCTEDHGDLQAELTEADPPSIGDDPSVAWRGKCASCIYLDQHDVAAEPCSCAELELARVQSELTDVRAGNQSLHVQLDMWQRTADKLDRELTEARADRLRYQQERNHYRDISARERNQGLALGSAPVEPETTRGQLQAGLDAVAGVLGRPALLVGEHADAVRAVLTHEGLTAKEWWHKSEGYRVECSRLAAGWDRAGMAAREAQAELTRIKAELEGMWLEGWAAGFKPGVEKLEKLGIMSDPIRVLTDALERELRAHNDTIAGSLLTAISQTSTGEISERLRAANAELTRIKADNERLQTERDDAFTAYELTSASRAADSDKSVAGIVAAKDDFEKLAVRYRAKYHAARREVRRLNSVIRWRSWAAYSGGDGDDTTDAIGKLASRIEELKVQLARWQTRSDRFMAQVRDRDAVVEAARNLASCHWRADLILALQEALSALDAPQPEQAAYFQRVREAASAPASPSTWVESAAIPMGYAGPEAPCGGKTGAQLEQASEPRAIVVGSTWRQCTPPGIHVRVTAVDADDIEFRWLGARAGAIESCSPGLFRLWFAHVYDLKPADAAREPEAISDPDPAPAGETPEGDGS